VLTGVLAAIQVYAAQLVWPEIKFPDTDTAFVYVAGKAGGQWLFNVVNFALLVATVGSGMGSQLGAGRLLYGMGRDNAIPRRFFGVVSSRTQIPRNNILLVGAFALVGSLTLDYALGAELLNFGALIAFMGVNICCFVRYFVRGRRTIGTCLPPLLGFAVCAFLWWNLGPIAKIAGFVWLGVAVLYGAWRTSGFRKPLEFQKLEN
jgi:amino acid transporter